jgi:hypothetical protein
MTGNVGCRARPSPKRPRWRPPGRAYRRELQVNIQAAIVSRANREDDSGKEDSIAESGRSV